jgi:hypothetical protein
VTAALLLSQLAQRHVVVARGDGPTEVTIDAPAGALTAADLATLRAHQPALLALLADLEQLARDGTAARLRAIAATLTPDEHHRLAGEAGTDDRLAELLQAVLASSPGTEGA